MKKMEEKAHEVASENRIAYVSDSEGMINKITFEENTDFNDLREKTTEWIKNEAEGTKQCNYCKAYMRGWAYREPFDYCPKCGRKAEKAM